jgi:large subunit ribosomal protein L17
MRHLKSTKKFKRTTEERRRLKIDLATALIKERKITTFTARAKWFRPFFERLVTLCKRNINDIQAAYKLVRPFLSEEAARILIEKIVPKLQDRPGGYTKQFKLMSKFNATHDKSIVMISE